MATTADTSINPCEQVRRSCKEWLKRPECSVRINSTKIPSLVQQLEIQPSIEWDEEQWHYQPPNTVPDRQERIALYILALDSVNYCFWPHAGYEYANLAQTLTSMAMSTNDGDEFLFSARNLASMTVQKMNELFTKYGTDHLLPPDLEQRCDCWREVGQVLLENYHGSAWRLIESGNQSAVQLVQLLTTRFSKFRDITRDVWFLKRAQICVADWNAALQLQLPDIDQLTTFADYRVPQLLRDLEILVYCNELATLVDQQVEIACYSDDELSIRAATVEAVEQIVAALSNAQGGPLTAVETDWYLWQVGEKRRLEMKPHHRVRTIYY